MSQTLQLCLMFCLLMSAEFPVSKQQSSTDLATQILSHQIRWRINILKKKYKQENESDDVDETISGHSYLRHTINAIITP